MGTYTGTDGGDTITVVDIYISEGVTADPPGTAPSKANDILYGLGGSDFLFGGMGRDRLYGGSGSDILDTAGDHSRLDGGSGPDTLRSSGDHGALHGGTGSDDLISSGDHSTLHGGSGPDYLSCWQGGDESLFGQEGADILLGGGGDDKLNGGAGGDTLKEEEGQDRLTGSTGNDVFEFLSPKEGRDRITDFHNTKGDNDRIAIDVSAFKGGLEAGAPLAPEQFQAGAGHEAQTAEVRFLFDANDQTLWFDQNGDADGGLTLIADLRGSAQLTGQDIWLV